MFVQEYEFLINRKVNKCNLLAYLLLTTLNKVRSHVDESPANTTVFVKSLCRLRSCFVRKGLFLFLILLS